MAKPIQESTSYNGLLADFKLLAQFVFIFETELKLMNKQSEFKEKYPKAFNYVKDLCKKIKHVKTVDIPNQEITDKYTLFFAKNNSKCLDFLRHLRNSFTHALLSKQNERLFISDKKTKNKESCKGYLDYKIVKQFIVELQKEYDEHNKNV